MVAMFIAAVLDRVTKVAAPGDVGWLTVGGLDETAALMTGSAGGTAAARGAGSGDAGI